LRARLGTQWAVVRPGLGLKLAICLALVAITFAVFGQTLGHGFVNYDDPAYVSENPRIHEGLNWSSITWAFTHIHSNNWHPLTTMSHMLDWQLFGAKAGAHHLIDLLLHSANAVLLFILLQQMTGRLWSSAFVAAVFAIHPLHVESVAWISERKDVLSSFFFFLTLFAYFHYARKPGAARYVTMSILFALGLMSKPMLVTLPAILLLLDYWPLRRFERSTMAWLIIEKLPLLALSIASAIITVIVQNHGEIGLVRLDVLPLSWRIANALSATLVYIRQMFWPTDLALAYNHPGKLPVWEIAALATVLVLMTIATFVFRKRYPYLLTGWCWYLIMLLPVVGLIQVGGQAHADRYTYLPQIGLYIGIVWAIVDLTLRWRHRVPALAAMAAILLSALAVRAHGQVQYWRDSETLWRHALAVTKDNDVAHLGLGMLFANQARLSEAITELQGLAARHPNDADVKLKLADALAEKEGRTNEAIHEYQEALGLGPNPDVETTLANLMLNQGRTDDALRYYGHVAQVEPSSALAHYNLAVCLHRLGRVAEAIPHYREALRINPNYPDAKEFLDQALLEKGDANERFRSQKP
jgi:tetratricopeptide (TPR) repeat protein